MRVEMRHCLAMNIYVTDAPKQCFDAADIVDYFSYRDPILAVVTGQLTNPRDSFVQTVLQSAKQSLVQSQRRSQSSTDP